VRKVLEGTVSLAFSNNGAANTGEDGEGEKVIKDG
jgi:hypothetical protein